MVAVVLALCLGVATAPAAPAGESIEQDLHDTLDLLRERAGLDPLERPDALQRLAGERATRIAARPVERRLPHPVPLDDALDDWPELRPWSIQERIVVVPPEIVGSERIRAAWDNPEAGALALDGETIAAGLGARVADDGALVFVALFRSADWFSDREEIETLVVEAINEVRIAHGMTRLRENSRLLVVARTHSEEMLKGNFMAHESLDGSMPADRVRAARIAFRLVGENVARSERPMGTVHGVIDEWMTSPGHRANILTPDFTETAVGAAIASDGSFYLTQLFLEP